MQITDSYKLHDQVELRPERFGALAYHFGNRRLTFLRSKQIVEVVETLSKFETVGEALAAAGVEEPRQDQYLKALSALENSEVICAR